MTRKRNDKTRARELQAVTGWAYMRCLKLVRENPGKDATDIAKAERLAGRP